PIRRLQECFHFALLQVRDQGPGRLLEGDCEYLRTPAHVFGTAQGDEVRQRTHRGQALVARRRRTSPALFQILQEVPDPVCREVFDLDPIDPLAGGATEEWQELAQHVAVTPLRVAGEVPLAGEVLQQEASDPGAQQRCVSHGCPPPTSSARRAGRLPATVRGSCSDKAGW